MIVDQGEKGDLTTKQAVEAAKLALKFAGNMSVQFSRERRKRAIRDMNPKLAELAEKDTIYKAALFGEHFAKEAKEREEQLKCLDKAAARGRSHQNFHYGRQTHNQLEGAKSLYPSPSLQDGGYSYAKRPPETGGLDGKEI